MDSIFDHPYMGRLLGMGAGGVVEAVSVGNFSHVQIWRPVFVASLARVAVSPIIITVTADATVRVAFSAVALTSNDGLVDGVDNLDSSIDVEIRSETNAAQLAVTAPFANFLVPAGVPYPIPGPFFFGSLQGITVNPIVTGVGVSIYCQFRNGIITTGLMA